MSNTQQKRGELLVGGQHDAQFFYIIRLFQSSTCFEQTRVHHQEVNCINTASGIVTLCCTPVWYAGRAGSVLLAYRTATYRE